MYSSKQRELVNNFGIKYFAPSSFYLVISILLTLKIGESA